MSNSPLWFVYHHNQLFIYAQDLQNPIPTEAQCQRLNFTVLSKHELGLFHNRPCFGLDVEFDENMPLPDDMKFMPLRQAALSVLNAELFHKAGRAAQLIEWHNTHQFCGRCGVKLYESDVERAKICPDCHYHFYPRISPSIIVLVKRGKEILLARSPHFAENIYSTLAGFVEPGESVEEAVHREVWEEVGVKIKNLTYRGSQPWPFPNSLMLAYTAEHAAGEITIDGVEICDAGWFAIDKLPQLPHKISIAHDLIHLFINQEF